MLHRAGRVIGDQWPLRQRLQRQRRQREDLGDITRQGTEPGRGPRPLRVVAEQEPVVLELRAAAGGRSPRWRRIRRAGSRCADSPSAASRSRRPRPTAQMMRQCATATRDRHHLPTRAGQQPLRGCVGLRREHLLCAAEDQCHAAARGCHGRCRQECCARRARMDCRQIEHGAQRHRPHRGSAQALRHERGGTQCQPQALRKRNDSLPAPRATSAPPAACGKCARHESRA